jgi:hypothetical protein
MHCHVLATLYRQCPGKEAELVERVEADTVEATGAAQPSPHSAFGGPDPFEVSITQPWSLFASAG